MPRSTVTPEIKAAALADLATGEQPAVVAQRYGLKHATVRQWSSRLFRAIVTPASGGASVTVVTLKKEQDDPRSIPELVLQTLNAKLQATQRIAEHAQHPDWLGRQSAADIARLFEALDTSAMVILDRLAQRTITNNDG